MRNSGFVMILTLIFMLVLAVMAMAMAYFITTETRGIGFQLDDTKALYLAQAGVERALREIRDDVLTTTQTGEADLRGNTTSGTAETAARRDYVRYFDEGRILTLDSAGAGTYVILSDYDLNYLGTRIKSVKIGCRYRRTGGGGSNPQLEILYTTNGSFPEAGNSSFTTTVTSTAFNARPFIVLDITGDRVWTPSIINSTDFQIWARGFGATGARDVQIDYLFAQLTYEIDTNTEAWYTGAYATFPIALGSGTIQSVSIADEAGKVHLNYASQPLLRYLMAECGIRSGTANVLATDIVTYRASNWFDSIEEVQQVSGMTKEYYDLIKDFVTVYPFINTSVTRPSGSRAPININTASREVLEAIFDPISMGGADRARLAQDIINTRATTPFTCFYSSDSTVTSDFYSFIFSRSYLSGAERSRVLDNADASPLIPVARASDYNCVSTEFCYYTDAFKIDSVGRVGDINLRVKNILKDDGSRLSSTYVGDTTLTGYWKESYE